jgi:hypothetical protein
VTQNTRRYIVLFVLFTSALAFLDAQEEPVTGQYALGDQTLSINAGLFVPLFFLTYQTPAVTATHLSAGGMGSLSWAAYVASRIQVGLEVGGVFAFSPNMNAILMLPITVKAAYVFTVYPFEIPVSLGIGMNVVKYSGESTVDFLVKPGASALWVYNSSWSFGLNMVYWWDMQFSAVAGQSRTGNFLELSLSALYHY